MRGVSHEGKAPVDELIGNVLGDRSAYDGMPFNAVEDGIAPERWPEVIGFYCELAESRFWYIGRGE